MPNALISVYNANGLEEVANALIDCGFGLYAAHDNAEALKKARIEATDMSYAYSSTYFRPVFGLNSFKFLPEVHAGLHAPDTEISHFGLRSRAIQWFDLLLADLDFAIFFRAKDLAAFNESVDYGNRGLIHSACLGYRAIICDELHLPRMDRIREIKEQGMTLRSRMEMRIIAEMKCAEYGRKAGEFLCMHLPPKA